MKIGNNIIDLKTPVVMTILNVTPDSFFAQSRTEKREDIENAVRKAIEEGASMIDVGGYSSRPGAAEVSVDEEIKRVAKGVEAIRRIAPEMTVSIDTFRAQVAETIINNLGPCIINDISAGELDDRMFETVAKHNAPYIAMHMKGTPETMQSQSQYHDIVAEVKEYFRLKLDHLRRLGINNVIIDPGFGFAKQTDQNMTLMGGLGELTELDAPILVGISRKSMIYRTLGCMPEEALIGTSALHWEALSQGANILRVHDTLAASQVIKLYNSYKKHI